MTLCKRCLFLDTWECWKRSFLPSCSYVMNGNAVMGCNKGIRTKDYEEIKIFIGVKNETSAITATSKISTEALQVLSPEEMPEMRKLLESKDKP